MEEELLSYLKKEGVNDTTVDKLVYEEVYNIKVFIALKEDHFLRLLKRKEISIGQHALLWDAWRKYTGSMMGIIIIFECIQLL